MKEYLLTAIIPVYNVEPYLERCLESLIDQEEIEQCLEILLIDDGSTDRSGEICDQYAARHSDISVIHKENGGLSSARNTGIAQARGRYVFFVDSDDYVERSMARILAEAVERFQNPDVIVFDGVEDDGKSRQIMRGLTSYNGLCVSGKDYLLGHYKERTLSVEACLYLYKKIFLCERQLCFREGILHEDVEFTPRAILLAGTVAEIDDQLYHYMVRNDSISMKKNKEKNIRDLFQTLREQDALAEQQEEELCRWMKDAILNSCLNMVYDARMYKKEYRGFLDKKFLRKKAATSFNRVRVCLCIINVRLYCMVNDLYKRMRKRRRVKCE